MPATVRSGVRMARAAQKLSLLTMTLSCGPLIALSMECDESKVCSLTRSDPEYVIRAAFPVDASAFAEVITSAQSTWVEWAGAALTPYDVAELTATWRARLEDQTTIAFVSLTEERITAVAAAGPEAASFQPSRVDNASAHLSTLFALPETHGDGSTQALHDAVLAELRARGYQTVRLWVPAGAQRARRFYERNGWEATRATTLFAGLERVEMRRSC